MKYLIFLNFLFAHLLVNAQRVLINPVCFNSDGDDYCVRMFNDKMFFISNVPVNNQSRIVDKQSGQPFTDVYEAKDCNRLDAKLVKNSIGQAVSINSSWYDGPVSFSKKDSVIFFSNTSEGREHGKMGIYWSKELVDGSFTDPKSFPYNSSDYSCMHPFFDEASSTLYFVSDLAKDSSGFDLYKSYFDGEKFEKLDTLYHLNSNANEVFPSIFNGTIYFSSNRIGGYGGLDIYFSDSQSNVKIMNAPFNGAFDDFAIFFKSENRGYFSSNHLKNGNDDDIFEFYIPTIIEQPIAEIEINTLVKELEVMLSQAASNSTESIILQSAIEKLRAQEKLISALKDKLFSNENRLMNYIDTASNLSFENRILVYQQVIEGMDVSSNSTIIQSDNDVVQFVNDVKQVKTDVKDLIIKEHDFFQEKLLPFLEEKPKQIGHINELIAHYQISDSSVSRLMASTYPIEFYFDFDYFKLSEDQLIELRKFIKSVQGYNGLIVLTGYTDSKGSASYNLKLSRKRARHIANLLIKEGFNSRKISIIAKGEAEPVSSNNSKSGRSKNRRVMVTL
jgi:outer membrane protein OmpA-like peptidoglycan-associated protein